MSGDNALDVYGFASSMTGVEGIKLCARFMKVAVVNELYGEEVRGIFLNSICRISEGAGIYPWALFTPHIPTLYGFLPHITR